MADIQFRVYGIPIAQGNHRVNRRGYIYDAAKGLDEWRTQVGWVARKHYRGDPLTDPIEMRLFFFMPVPKSAPKRKKLWATKRPDLDKLTRAVTDALTGVVYADDSQIVIAHQGKALAYDSEPGVLVEVEPLSGVPTF